VKEELRKNLGRGREVRERNAASTKQTDNKNRTKGSSDRSGRKRKQRRKTGEKNNYEQKEKLPTRGVGEGKRKERGEKHGAWNSPKLTG